jgi:hypothetical protein
VNQRSEIGRPPVLDDTKKSQICAIIAMGCSRATAASYVGCHRDTIRNTAGRDAAFADALEKADSQHEMRHMGFINRAAEEAKYWRAAAWALERKYPGRYGARRAELFTREQVLHIVAQLGELVGQEIANKREAKRIQSRLAELTAAFRPSAGDDE